MTESVTEMTEMTDDLDADLDEEVKSGAKCDVYWLMMIRILHLADSTSFKSHKLQYILGMAHGIIVYLLTISLQLTITAFLMLAATRIEAEYHGKFFNNTKMELPKATSMISQAVTTGAKIPDGGADYSKPGIMKECVAQLAVRYEWIYEVMIFIWVCNMLIEFKDVVKDISALIGIPRTTKGGSIFLEGGQQVVSLTPGARLALITLGPGMRCFVAIVLLFAGCKVLLFRPNLLLVLLSSMALGFVVNLDDLIMNALSGAATKKELDGLKLVYTKHNTRMHQYWIGGLSGLTHTILCMSGAALYVYGLEGTVMNFRETCWSYYSMFGDDELKPANDMMTFSDMFERLFKDMLKGLLFQ